MWSTSQILVVVGLVFELMSVVYQAKKVFHPFKSYKEKKSKYIDEKMKTFREKLAERERTWFWTLLLLFIGLLLQAIAVFVI
jgi:hypothetical protein